MNEEDMAVQAIAELIGNGFFDLEVASDGTIIYQLSENAEEISPKIYKVLKDHMTDELLDFAAKGLIDVRFNDELELEWKWTPKGIAHMESQGVTFDDDEE